jgi:four helix bundle protein
MTDPFENLLAWKKAVTLATRVYELLRYCRDFGLKEQMQRTAVAVASNIADGSERESPEEFGRYLAKARGLVAELRTQAYVALQTGKLPPQEAVEVIDECAEIAGMLYPGSLDGQRPR